MQLDSLRILVTGAARGIGLHLATRLAEAGAAVVAGDLDADALANLEASTAGAPGRVHTRRLDVADAESRRAFVAFAADVTRDLGGPNALVNNAGIIRDGLLVRRDRKTGAITALSDADWDAVIAVNLTGATLLTRALVHHMATAGTAPGVVVNISSIARHGNRGQSNYVAAKAALSANTVTWAREFAPFGVRAACVAPGMIETPMTRSMNQRARDAIVARIPVGRVGEPEDIWLAVRFALECDYFNGRTLDVDGGVAL